MFRVTRICALLTVSTLWILAASDGPVAQRIVREPSIAANIRVNVNMVLVPVSVMDAYGRSVTGLQRENFRVLDGGQQVPIVTFGRQDQPITVGLIFDCSGSMQGKFRTAREAPRELFRQLNPDDKSFLITVSDKAELRQSLTSDFEELENSLIFSYPHGRTSLLDAVEMGLQQIRASRNSRKALVIVSDGGENNSRYTLHQLKNLAVESDTQIFAAGLYDVPRTPEEADGPLLMTQLCEETGGAHFIIKDLSALSGAMSKIGVMLHSQYVLGYYPPDERADGKYRKIKVQLRIPSGLVRLQISARAGYYLPDNLPDN